MKRISTIPAVLISCSLSAQTGTADTIYVDLPVEMEDTFRFWRTLANRYKDEPAIALYELCNEPVSCYHRRVDLPPTTQGRFFKN